MKVQDFGVNAIAAGEVEDTIYLYSGSLFGELGRPIGRKKRAKKEEMLTAPFSLIVCNHQIVRRVIS